MTKKSWINNLYEVYFLIMFHLVMGFSLILPKILTLFVRKRKKLRLWNIASKISLDTVFFLAGIKKMVYHHNKKIPKKVIFCSNHQGMLDGITYQTIIPGNVFAMTQPFDLFPWIIKPWIKNVCDVPVMRDNKDVIKCKNGLCKIKAIKKSVYELDHLDESMFIFPEGHFEHDYHYLKFHTGAIRIALRAKRNIVPCKIEHSNKLCPPNHPCLYPGVLEIIIGEEWDLSKHYGKHTNHSLVKRLTKELENKVKHLERPNQTHTPHEKRRKYHKAGLRKITGIKRL